MLSAFKKYSVLYKQLFSLNHIKFDKYLTFLRRNSIKLWLKLEVFKVDPFVKTKGVGF